MYIILAESPKMCSWHENLEAPQERQGDPHVWSSLSWQSGRKGGQKVTGDPTIKGIIGHSKNLGN